MAFSSTAAVLDSLKTRIEALTPSQRVNEDDRFRVRCEDSDDQHGNRSIEVTASGARRIMPNRTCNDWETQVQLTVEYQGNPAEVGRQTTHQTALRDAEDLLADLYTWATVTDGIHKIEPELASIQNNGDGYITSTRTLRVEFIRG